MTKINLQDWDLWLLNQENPHLLQKGAWGDFKNQFGWTPARIIVDNAGSQILFRRLPLGLTIAYIAKGPIGIHNAEFWKAVHMECKKHKAVFLRIEPDSWDEQNQEFDYLKNGFVTGKSIQPRRTIVVDITGTETEWLERMKQKTRYNIRLAEKKEVKVQISSEVDVFYKIMEETGERDGFGIHSFEYYNSVYDHFEKSDQVAILIARYGDIPLAAIMVFREGKRAWYFYGASNDLERNRMPAYLLQFEAMKWAANAGCQLYDLWGIPDFNEEILESEFSQRSDGLWGVYRFKRGFGGTIKRSSSAFDWIYMPVIYKFYCWLEKRKSGF
jgi:lipid II:glycine glycyltransferase (peptidoglycan interpeptide bridge formation enzyme)